MNIVFDLGGVLLRWRPALLIANLWPQRAAIPAQTLAVEFFEAYGGDWGLFDQGLIDAPTVADRIALRTGWPLAEVAQVVAAGPDELQPLPDTVALIEELKSAGHRLFFLSNMPSPYADLLEDRLPFEQWFEAGVFSSRVKHSKPGEHIYRIASERFGNSSEGYVFLDDQPANISAAIAYGWQGLLFTSAAKARQDLAALVA